MNLQNAIIDKVQTMKDGSIKVVLVTRELSPEQMAELFFSVNKEIVKIDLPEDNHRTKSESQRLRDVIYVDWEQHHKEEFQTSALYYAHQMEKIINHIKDRLS